MPRIANTGKYQTQQPNTYWFGRFWSTIAVAAKTYNINQQTIRARISRGMAGLDLVKPSFTVNRRTGLEYRKKLLAIHKTYGQTPSALAAEAGVTVAAMRYRIKKLDLAELMLSKKVLVEGWSAFQIRRRRHADAVAEAVQREREGRLANEREARERAAGVARVADKDDDSSLDGVEDDQDWLKEWR